MARRPLGYLFRCHLEALNGPYGVQKDAGLLYIYIYIYIWHGHRIVNVFGGSCPRKNDKSIDFGSVLGSLDPQKWVFRVGEVLFLRKSRFFKQNLVMEWFLNDFGCLLDIFLGPFSHQNRIPKSMKFNEILDRFWKDFGPQLGSILAKFWLQKSIKNLGRFLMWFWTTNGEGSAAEAGPIK